MRRGGCIRRRFSSVGVVAGYVLCATVFLAEAGCDSATAEMLYNTDYLSAKHPAQQRENSPQLRSLLVRGDPGVGKTR